MLKKNAVGIGQLVREFLRQEGLEMPLAEYRAEQAWAEVVGLGMARYTRSVKVRGGVMYVQLSSSLLRANMQMNKDGLVARINQIVGQQVVSSIVLL